MLSPLLTIAIPTWNRATYLKANLDQLRSELKTVTQGCVEIIVSDNCSPDETPTVVNDAIQNGLSIIYKRNEENIGWARNFIQCFDLAAGKYVLLLGDDDLLVDGTLALLVAELTRSDYGVVCLRPYGYDIEFRREYPGSGGGLYVYDDANEFIVSTSRCFTLTSALVINKSLLIGVDIRQFVTTDLATFHLVLRAALAARKNLYIKRYSIASKRQNSASYEYARVFVGQFWSIIDAHVIWGLSPRTVGRLELRRLFCYYPFYLFNQRLSNRGDCHVTLEELRQRFGKRLLFKIWLVPILRAPRPIGIAWGAMATTLGRVAGGDLQRGMKFAVFRICNRLTARH